MREIAELGKAKEILEDVLLFSQRPEDIKLGSIREYVTLRRKRYGVHAICKVLRKAPAGPNGG